MAHPEQQRFIKACIDGFRPNQINKVLEIGSYDVNGTFRTYLNVPSYTGVDLVAGPGVDLVSYGHLVDIGKETCDFVFSGEVFEHDPYYESTFENMLKHVKPGGLMVFTCASKGRPEHGTTRTNPKDSPGTQNVGLDYYKNLQARDFRRKGLLSQFDSYSFFFNPLTSDLYFWGIKRSDSQVRRPIALSEVLRIIFFTRTRLETGYLVILLFLRSTLPNRLYERVRLRGFKPGRLGQTR